MKRFLPLFLLFLGISLGLFAQAQVKEETRPAVRFGLNGGVEWQSSDVRTIGGGGFGATFEVPIVENDHSLIGVGLRARYLWGVSYGKNLKPTTDFNFPGGQNYLNHRTSATNWDLELLLKANRLRANTGILLYVWGGVGVMGYKPKQNNFDGFFSSSPYNYAAGIGNGSIFSVGTQLDFLRDGSYETRVPVPSWAHWRFAPSVGIGFGYEFSPAFAMSAEWKITFPQTDLLDGYVATNKNFLNYNKDIHHYAGLSLDFGLFGGSTYQSNSNTDPNVYTPSGDGAAIVMVVPSGPTYEVPGACRFEVKARIYNVHAKALIIFTQNGTTIDPASFSFNESTGDFSAMVNLAPGINNFTLTARNRYANATQSFSATCQAPIIVPIDPLPTGVPPQIFVTYPTACPAIMADCRGVIKVTVYNIRSKQDVAVYHNGLQVPIQYYEYYPSSNEVVMNVDLTPGDHRFEFIAQTQFGQATATAMLRCPQAQPNLPGVVITTPGITPYVSPNCLQTVVAAITGVQSKNDISIYVDRVLLSPNAWSYNPNTRQVTLTVSLMQGIESIVEIIASNQFGRASDIQMLRCYQQMPPPDVVIVRPTGGVYQGTDCNQIVTAQIFNISGIQDIRVLFGNSVVSPQNYSFNPMNQLFVMDVPLTPGIVEQFTIIGTNSVGSDQASVSLSCTQPIEQQITICHIPPANPANVQTLTIPVSQWLGHQGHGDIQGACSQTMVTICFQGQQLSISQSALAAFQNMGATTGPCQEPNIQICHIPPGNPAAAATMTIPQSAWPMHQGHGDVQGACSGTKLTICYNGQNITVSQTVWPVYQNLGATQGPCPPRTVTICHIPPGNPAAAQTLTIPETAWASHQAHGDVQGPCSTTMVVICYQGQTMTVSQSVWPVYQNLGATQGACPPRQITICHIPPGNPTAPVTMTINENQWAAHQGHGDVQGACATQQTTLCYQGQTVTVSNTAVQALLSLGATQGACPPQEIQICHIPPGNPSGAMTITIPQSAWAAHQGHGDVQGACSSNLISICYQNQTLLISESVWPYYQSLGATRGACPTRTIQICHIPPGNPSGAQTITIPENAWLGHQAHGDTQGACNMTPMTICYRERDSRAGQTLQIPTAAWPAYQVLGATQGPCPVQSITICHIPPGSPNTPQTLTIPMSEWPSHQAHGDVQGVCDMSTVQICIDGQTLSVPRASWPSYQSQGATQGPCPVQEITICHIPPGDPSHPQTIVIPQSAWASHQSHGDTQGACNMTMVVICLNGREVQVPRASLQVYLTQGAIEGNCPQENEITICHIPPGNPGNPQTISIPQSAWPTHQGHGDTQGACNMTPITICFNDQTMTVPTAAWPYYQSQGATQGACPEPQIVICHIPPGDPSHPQTITIPQSAWASHQTHGDTRGACNMTMIRICLNGQDLNVPTASWAVYQSQGAVQGECPEADITICHVPPGDPSHPQTLTIAPSAWPAHQAHGDQQGACNMTPMRICYNNQEINIPTSSWAAYQALGAQLGDCPEQQLTICHIPPGNPGNPQTITVPASAWPAHQAHGDTQGACNTTPVTICVDGQTMTVPTAAWPAYQSQGATQGPCPEPQMTICHIPPGNPRSPQTITIPQSAWAAHQAHGDTQGACNMGMMTICLNGETMNITNATFNYYQLQGATQGACPEVDITICHIPPGNPDNPQTITVPPSAWPAHQSHGDTQGACNMTTMSICADGNTRQIPTAAWPYYQSQGWIQGPCPSQGITICHIPPGNPENPQTLTIPQSAWPAHQAHGDTQGACNMTLMSICIDGQNMNVPSSSWAAYQAQGATQGPCPQARITICHIPPGDPLHPQTIEIEESAWAAHQAHRDVVGTCNLQQITICYQNQTILIPIVSWPIYQEQGATQGACLEGGQGRNNGGGKPVEGGGKPVEGGAKPVEGGGKTVVPVGGKTGVVDGKGAVKQPVVAKIVICHYPPENPKAPVTLEIPATEWEAYAKKGAKQGACPSVSGKAVPK
jgi:hypothetical protein